MLTECKQTLGGCGAQTGPCCICVSNKTETKPFRGHKSYEIPPPLTNGNDWQFYIASKIEGIKISSDQIAPATIQTRTHLLNTPDQAAILRETLPTQAYPWGFPWSAFPLAAASQGKLPFGYRCVPGGLWWVAFDNSLSRARFYPQSLEVSTPSVMNTGWSMVWPVKSVTSFFPIWNVIYSFIVVSHHTLQLIGFVVFIRIILIKAQWKADGIGRQPEGCWLPKEIEQEEQCKL